MISKFYAQKFCRDDISKIENYEEAIASAEKYDCHHRLELTIEGAFARSSDELKSMNMYYNRPYFELIFLKRLDHIRLHAFDGRTGKWNRGKHHSEETKRKMRGKVRTEEFKRNVSEYKKEHNPMKNPLSREKIRIANTGKLKGLTWKKVDGKRIWMNKEEK